MHFSLICSVNLHLLFIIVLILFEFSEFHSELVEKREKKKTDNCVISDHFNIHLNICRLSDPLNKAPLIDRLEFVNDPN